jgi:CO dehydrogenase/acetyl-CoA synthase gamma subunit (corrinoid Fe-S protein)
MKLKFITFLLWLHERVDDLLWRFDKCCYPGCENRADNWCITGGHRHCYEHESGFYNDVEFCQSCYDSMTPEERAQELLEAERYENESGGESRA